VVAIRNRKLQIPENAEELLEVHGKGTRMNDEILQRTDQFRYIILSYFRIMIPYN
jgi:hypothetical protein